MGSLRPHRARGGQILGLDRCCKHLGGGWVEGLGAWARVVWGTSSAARQVTPGPAVAVTAGVRVAIARATGPVHLHTDVGCLSLDAHGDTQTATI